MNVINKQKFLAELGRLLTFMYEEDKQTALELYSEMFDNAEDEQSMLHYLVSPTRQAVVLARAYDAKERKAQVQAAGSSDEPAPIPAFVEGISRLRENAPLRHEDAPAVLPQEKGQISLFGEDDTMEFADEPEAMPVPADVTAAAAAVEAAAVQTEVSEEKADSADDSAEDKASDDVEKFSDGIDSFLSDFRIPEDVEAAEKSLDEAAHADTAADAPIEAQAEDEAEMEATAADEPLFSLGSINAEAAQPAAVKRVPRVALLILYILLAVPLTLAGIVLLLIPTLLCLALAVAVVSLGVFAVSAALGSFAVFADILLVLGAAIVILALGLLLAWLFIWFIAGPIVGLIKAVVDLGGKWCYKEVAAE